MVILNPINHTLRTSNAFLHCSDFAWGLAVDGGHHKRLLLFNHLKLSQGRQKNVASSSRWRQMPCWCQSSEVKMGRPVDVSWCGVTQYHGIHFAWRTTDALDRPFTPSSCRNNETRLKPTLMSYRLLPCVCARLKKATTLQHFVMSSVESLQRWHSNQVRGFVFSHTLQYMNFKSPSPLHVAGETADRRRLVFISTASAHYFSTQSPTFYFSRRPFQRNGPAVHCLDSEGMTVSREMFIIAFPNVYLWLYVQRWLSASLLCESWLVREWMGMFAVRC